MGMHLLLILGLISPLGTDGTEAELRRLDGTWVVESVERDPREQQPGREKGIECIVKAGRLVARLPGEKDPRPGSLILRVSPAESPKAIDITPAGEKETIPAIYELRDNLLRVCWSLPKKPRPTEFRSEPGSGYTLVVLKRKNP